MIKSTLIIGYDQLVAAWTWRKYNLVPLPVDHAIGFLRDGEFVGSAMLHWFNGNNIELSFFGPGFPSVSVFRNLARVGLERFNVQRCTIHSANPIVVSGAQKFGFKLEGRERHFYGHDKHAVRLALFRDGIEKMAKRFPQKAAMLSAVFASPPPLQAAL